MNSQTKWEAVLANDRAYDGKFFYGVQSTGIFCRPSCPSKPPLQKNIVYFDTADAAMEAGFRPCKRCRPDLLAYQPLVELAENIKSAIDRGFADSTALAQELEQLGLSRGQMTQVFASLYGQTPSEYANACRIQAAKEALVSGDRSVLEVGLAVGFEGLSSFYSIFRKSTGLTPGEYRRRWGKAGEEEVIGSYYAYDLALGRLSIATDGSHITAIRFADGLEGSGPRRGSQLTDQAARQLEEYFAGERRGFELPLRPKGTPFQRSVWAALGSIPYGSTRSYGQVAELIGSPKASRAVGMANNKNPILIAIPCHRVVGADGSLVGYAAPLEIKKRLLHLEQFGV